MDIYDEVEELEKEIQVHLFNGGQFENLPNDMIERYVKLAEEICQKPLKEIGKDEKYLKDFPYLKNISDERNRRFFEGR